MGTRRKRQFLAFLQERYGQDYAATGEDVVVNPLTGKNYDYELRSQTAHRPVIALEIFRLVDDEEDIARHFTWTDITQRIGRELRARGITGYSIRTPHLRVLKFKRDEFAANIADQLATAIAQSCDEAELRVGGYVLHKLPGDDRVSFSYLGGARAINPYGSASDALDDLLPAKNAQLNVQGRLRTLLEDFFDLLSANCDEHSVLAGIDLMLRYGDRIKGVSGRKLAAVLDRYRSPSAEELRARCPRTLNA